MVEGRHCAATKMVTQGILCAEEVSEDLRIAAADYIVVENKNPKLRPNLKKGYRGITSNLHVPRLGNFPVLGDDLSSALAEINVVSKSVTSEKGVENT